MRYPLYGTLLLTRMQEGENQGKKYCTRGLEGHTTVGAMLKKRNRATSIAAVLTEQSNQWIADKVDFEAMAEVYRKTTTRCQTWGHVVGMRDQRVAKGILKPDNNIENIFPATVSLKPEVDASNRLRIPPRLQHCQSKKRQQQNIF